MSSSSLSISTSSGSTSELSQVIAGTVDGVDVGASVFIYDNQADEPIGTSIVAADGTWSAEVVLPASDNVLVAKTTSSSGDPLVSNVIDITFEPVLSPPSTGSTGGSTVRVPRAVHPTWLHAHAAPETFVFAHHPGHVRITDFNVAGPDHDRVRLSASDFTSIAAVLHDIHEVGQDAVLRIDAHDTITFGTMTARALRTHVGDFALHA